MKPKFFTTLLAIGLAMTATQANALVFPKTGTIIRTLSDSVEFGGCMIELNSSIGNNCPQRWVSFDCKALTTPAGDGSRHYATALLAASLNKQITLQIDNSKKVTTYCVAKRIDILF